MSRPRPSQPRGGGSCAISARVHRACGMSRRQRQVLRKRARGGRAELDGRHRLRRTVILNAAFAVFPLESVAEHLTMVRPIGNRLPERGLQVTGTWLSALSLAVTLYVTRTLFAPLGARTVFDVAPLSVGGVTSNSSPGTTSVPVHVSSPPPPPSHAYTRRPLEQHQDSNRSTLPATAHPTASAAAVQGGEAADRGARARGGRDELSASSRRTRRFSLFLHKPRQRRGRPTASAFALSPDPRAYATDAVDRDVHDVAGRRIVHRRELHVRAEVHVGEPLQ